MRLSLPVICLGFLLAVTGCGMSGEPCDCPAPDAVVLVDPDARTLYGAPACQVHPGAEKSILKTAQWHYLQPQVPLPASCALLVP